MRKLSCLLSLTLTSLFIGCSSSLPATSSDMPPNISPTCTSSPIPTSTPQPSSTPQSTPSAKPKLTLSVTEVLDSPTFKQNTPYSLHGALSVDGIHIKDCNNKIFQLRGVSTHGVQWYEQYTSLETFKELTDNFNINSIRLALYADEESMLPENQDSYIKILEDAISNATSLGLYVVIDWHILADGNPLKNEENSNIFFDYFSTKYQNYPNILFEICNEPNGSSANWDDAIKPYAETILSTIRKNSPNSIVIVGTPHWCQSPLSVVRNKIDDKNILYAFHFYADSHGLPLRDTFKRAVEKYELPIIVTEFGTCDSSGNGTVNIESSNTWLDCIDSYNVSWFIWNLSDKNEASSILFPNTKTSNWKDSDLTSNGLYIKERLLKY